MKNLLILAMLTIFIFACGDDADESPQDKEVILSISHIKILGECDDPNYCKFELKIEKDSIYTLKRAYHESSNLPEVKKSYTNSDVKIDSLSNLIDFNNVKSNSYITECYPQSLNSKNKLRRLYLFHASMDKRYMNPQEASR